MHACGDTGGKDQSQNSLRKVSQGPTTSLATTKPFEAWLSEAEPNSGMPGLRSGHRSGNTQAWSAWPWGGEEQPAPAKPMKDEAQQDVQAGPFSAWGEVTVDE